MDTVKPRIIAIVEYTVGYDQYGDRRQQFGKALFTEYAPAGDMDTPWVLHRTAQRIAREIGKSCCLTIDGVPTFTYTPEEYRSDAR